ncbi:conjugal transfer protein TrbK [Paracoccus mutanolyticus]|uniref:Conjugal transfer protein TrbK n=1 Tax=Paracoccus mutanolyticus TaxID=1499308 RepID=A0ABM6WUT2_9RHOB|nr:putative entry exclusion protein TrbK-alt [Paracoccus mutanolyticus]AWX94445.1 conjugal transfer protein TrbK [Paracoccus mutanolyticus]
MEVKALARLAAILFLAIVMTVTLIRMERSGDLPPLPGRQVQPQVEDPLREGQRRCQRMGEAAAEDAHCLAIWAETRDRFLGRTPEAAPPQPARGNELWAGPASSTISWRSSPAISTAASGCWAAKSPSSPPR